MGAHAVVGLKRLSTLQERPLTAPGQAAGMSAKQGATVARFIRRNMVWSESRAGSLLTLDLSISEVPKESESDTAERFEREAMRIARAFLSEQDGDYPTGR
jgi:D-serine deaminase-like pyridoxal phosphate-dependent protein